MSKMEIVTAEVNQAEILSRKIWLVGIGAFGKGLYEAQGQYKKLNNEVTKLFNNLVTKGEKLEIETKEKFQSETDIIKNKIEVRVTSVRSKLGLDKKDFDDKMKELSVKIDALSESVEKMVK